MKRLLPLLILLLFAFQTVPYLNDGRRFHPDEAFFMTFARHAAIGGDWWLQGSLDKPPLTIYANALMITLIGADTLPNGVLTLDPMKGEFVGRLFSFFCGMMLVAVTMRLALDLSKHTLVAYIGGVVLATLPMLHLYSASAFMDMPMVALALAALVAAARQKTTVSGVLLALAFAAKPQAVFFVPLVVWYVIVNNPTQRARSILRFGMALGIGLALLFVWDAVRPGDSVFALGAANNDFFAPTFEQAIIRQRLLEWIGQGDTALFGVCVALSFGLWIKSLRLICLWILIYVLAHLVVFTTLYQRYLLVTLPLMVIASVWLIHYLVSNFIPNRKLKPNRVGIWILNPIFLVFTVAGVLGVWNWALFGDAWRKENSVAVLQDFQPLGDFHELATYLNAKPLATVIYDHWLGWSLKYYMGEWQDKRIVYYPSPQEMIADALMLEETETRYFVAPRGNFSAYGLSSPYSESAKQWLEAFRQAGFEVVLEEAVGYFELYAIKP